MEFDEVIEERHSVRNFSPKKPNWREIIEAINAANEIPLAGNISTLRFILVDKSELISRLADACQQDFVGKAQYVVVICSDNKQIERAYDERGVMYSRQQAGAAAEQLILKLTDLGLSSCWIGAFVDDMIKNILRIPEDVVVEAVIPIGYELGKRISKSRKPNLDNTLFFNQYKEKRMKPLKRPEAF